MNFISSLDSYQNSYPQSIEEAPGEAAEECIDTLRSNLRSIEDSQREKQTMADVKSNLELKPITRQSTALGSFMTPRLEGSSLAVRDSSRVEQDMLKKRSFFATGSAFLKDPSGLLSPRRDVLSNSCEMYSNTPRNPPAPPVSTHLLKGVTSSLPQVSHLRAAELDSGSMQDAESVGLGSKPQVLPRMSVTFSPALSNSPLNPERFGEVSFHLSKYTFENHKGHTEEHAEESGINKIVSRSPIDTQVDFEEMMTKN